MEVALLQTLAALNLVERAIQAGDGLHEALLAGVHRCGVVVDWLVFG